CDHLPPVFAPRHLPRPALVNIETLIRILFNLVVGIDAHLSIRRDLDREAALHPTKKGTVGLPLRYGSGLNVWPVSCAIGPTGGSTNGWAKSEECPDDSQMRAAVRFIKGHGCTSTIV